MKTNQTQLKDKIRKICTYHSEDDIGGEGTNGYCLSEEQFQKLFSLFLSWHQEELKKLVGKLKCEVPEKPIDKGQTDEEFANESIVYVGRFNYNKALDDILREAGIE